MLLFLPLILFSLILPGIKYINAKLKQIHPQITLFIIFRAERISLSITSSKRVNWSFYCFILITTKGSNTLCWPRTLWPALLGLLLEGQSPTPVLKAIFSLTILTQPEGHSQTQMPPAEKIVPEKLGVLEAHLKALTGLQLTIWRRGQLGAKYKWGNKT